MTKAFPRSSGDDGRSVLLLGLDFGSTTSSAVVARATVSAHAVTGRMTLETPTVVFRTEPVFTPFVDGRIDAEGIGTLLDGWLSAGDVQPDAVFSGGALVTGLAARADNADALTSLVRQRLGDAVVARADDPRLESWLAFMGSCGRASEALGARPILNLDIGGGTTNAALGVAGEVVATGCHFIGAHHLRFQSGTRRLIGLSDHGRDLLAELNVATGPGDLLSESAVGTVIDWYVAGLEAIVTGRRDFFDSPVARSHEQAPVAFDIRSADALIAFSGGVGELLYRHAAGEPLPGTTAYGDLGVDLALGIAASPLLSRDLQRFVPAQRGRATVYGLAMHSAALAGATLFLPDPSALPLRDLPIVARCDAGAEAAQLRAALQLAATHRGGACLQIVDAGGVLGTGAGARQLGERIAAALESGAYPADRSLVLLVSTNAGKALGSYATRWSRLPHRVIVIDEVPARRAHFVHLGSAREGIVPVSFYGIH